MELWIHHRMHANPCVLSSWQAGFVGCCWDWDNPLAEPGLHSLPFKVTCYRHSAIMTNGVAARVASLGGHGLSYPSKARQALGWAAGRLGKASAGIARNRPQTPIIRTNLVPIWEW
jgi:hypothetical protein